MKVCFPIQNNEGIESLVYKHFGSAPEFLIVNTELQTAQLLNDLDPQQVHRAVIVIGGLDIDAVVVNKMGSKALTKLNAGGIKVYRRLTQSVKDNLALLQQNRLPELTFELSCRYCTDDCVQRC
jgi:predicted Fe-Mo cluster-binding NifX family protein